jgi:hypothetical protein
MKSELLTELEALTVHFSRIEITFFPVPPCNSSAFSHSKAYPSPSGQPGHQG